MYLNAIILLYYIYLYNGCVNLKYLVDILENILFNGEEVFRIGAEKLISEPRSVYNSFLVSAI